jgi:hypothetical protein
MQGEITKMGFTGGPENRVLLKPLPKGVLGSGKATAKRSGLSGKITMDVCPRTNFIACLAS